MFSPHAPSLSVYMAFLSDIRVEAQTAVDKRGRELDDARSRYQAAVRRLHSSAAVAECSGPPAAMSEEADPSRIDLEKILGGGEFILDDSDFFGVEDLGETIAQEDRDGAQRRKEALQEPFK